MLYAWIFHYYSSKYWSRTISTILYSYIVWAKSIQAIRFDENTKNKTKKSRAGVCVFCTQSERDEIPMVA